jgi:hypothetical protein
MRTLRIFLVLLLAIVGCTSLAPMEAATAVSSYYVPPRPTSSNPITFANITSRVNDIPRAVFDSLQETKARNASLAGSRIKVNIIRGAHVKGTYYDKAEWWIHEEVKALAHFANFDKAYIFIYDFKDISWIQSKMNSLLNNASIKADRIYGGKTCAEQDWNSTPMVANITNGWDVAINRAKPFEKKIPYVLAGYCGDSDLEKWSAISGTSHELSHQYQVVQFWDNKLNLYPNSAKREPCWTVEGQAGLAGYSFETNYDQFLVDLAQMPRPYYMNSAATSAYETAPLYWGPSHVKKYLSDASTQMPGCSLSNRFALSYSLGAYTVMALSAIGGWESTWALYPMLNSGMSLNSAFKRVYGITWDQALPTLSQAVSALVMKQLDPPGYGTYSPTDQTNVVSLVGKQGCSAYDASDSQTVRARLQVLQDGHWLDVPTIEQSWASDPSICRGLPTKLSWVVTLKVALDHGVSYRFLYLGDVNIGLRDEYGRGYSQTFKLP